MPNAFSFEAPNTMHLVSTAIYYTNHTDCFIMKVGKKAIKATPLN